MRSAPMLSAAQMLSGPHGFSGVGCQPQPSIRGFLKQVAEGFGAGAGVRPHRSQYR